MFDTNIIPAAERVYIINKLLEYGIKVDQITGKISYIDGTSVPELKCASIHLIRHAETLAVTKREFMSDTSQNSVLTVNGIESVEKQSQELDSYNFDVALYGPVPRVIHTMEIIMSYPQKFEAFKLQKLHGIVNTGWEYKNIEEIQYNPIFIARELENNVFARTPNGTSWGMVIANCVDVIDYINEKYADKRVLLISQGSVLRSLQILLRMRKHPWDDYAAKKMYHVGDDMSKKDYGLITKVFER